MSTIVAWVQRTNIVKFIIYQDPHFAELVVSACEVLLQRAHGGHDVWRALLELGAVTRQQVLAPAQVEGDVTRRLELTGHKRQRLVDVDVRQVLADHRNYTATVQSADTKHSSSMTFYSSLDIYDCRFLLKLGVRFNKNLQSFTEVNVISAVYNIKIAIAGTRTVVSWYALEHLLNKQLFIKPEGQHQGRAVLVLGQSLSYAARCDVNVEVKRIKH